MKYIFSLFLLLPFASSAMVPTPYLVPIKVIVNREQPLVQNGVVVSQGASIARSLFSESSNVVVPKIDNDNTQNNIPTQSEIEEFMKDKTNTTKKTDFKIYATIFSAQQNKCLGKNVIVASIMSSITETKILVDIVEDEEDETPYPYEVINASMTVEPYAVLSVKLGMEIEKNTPNCLEKAVGDIEISPWANSNETMSFKLDETEMILNLDIIVKNHLEQ